ncbi:MAG: PD40 domain-containing protein, partial [Candidatus Latescibacteria bacterium]|nr:PD40 domain-containing protein [Candidatus Latescibacterota bacterium]
KLLQKLLGVDMATLDRSWTSHLKQQYWPLLKDRRFPYDIASQIPPDGGKMTYVSPSWSLGGEMIAAIATDGIDLDIALVKVQDGGAVKKLTERMRGGVYTELKGREGTVAWAPDGERIAFVARKGPVDQLYIWDVYRETLVDTLIFAGIQEINTIAWSPDGRRLAFSGSQYGQTDIYVVDLTTKRLSQITNTPDMEDHPAWAPDNRRLAFSAKRETSFDILIVTPDSSTTATPLITSPTDDIWPRWLPDGDHLLFVSTRDGVNDLFVYDLRSGAERQLTKTTSGLSEPAVSPDGGKVAFISYARGRRGLYVMDLPFLGETRPIATSSPSDSALLTSDHHILTDSTTPSLPSVLLTSTSLTNAPDTAAVPSGAPYYRSPYRTKLDLDAFSTQVVLSNRFLNTVLQLSLSDLFGNHQLVFAVDYTSRISSINDFNFAALYSYTGRRMPIGGGVFNWTQFFGRRQFTQTVLGTFVEDEIWANRQMGLLINTSYPFDLYRRIDLSYTLVNETLEPVSSRQFSNDILTFDGTSTSNDTTTHLLRGAYVHDTIVYGYLGPTRGARYYLSAGRAVKLTSSDREFTHIELDYRKYLRAGGWSVFAFRLKGIAALGANGFTYYLGGPSLVTALGFGYDVNVGPLRGFDFGEFAGTRIALANLEYRIPIVRNLVFEWPGRWSVGTVEGTLFIDAGTAWNREHNLTLWEEENFHLIDLKMGVGFGFLVNFILPINVEFAKSTDLDHFSRDYRIHFSFGRSF